MELTLFVLSSFSLLIITVTMLCRANDLRLRRGWIWHARLLGFILSGCAPIGIIGQELLLREYPSVYATVFRIGLMLVFVTSPHLPPWWKFIGKGEQAR